MELSAGNLTLRPPTQDDGPGVLEAIHASMPELSPWMPWATDAYDLEAALSWVRGETGDRHRFVMVDCDGQIVGSCGLNHIDELNRSANLGYWVRSDQAGQGYATEATKLLHHYGHDVGGLHRIEIVMSVRNEASRRVAEKAGAHYDGRLPGCLRLHGEFHDAHCWSFVPD
jgi:RimJ/RimL family protein N-acetyltransferase